MMTIDDKPLITALLIPQSWPRDTGMTIHVRIHRVRQGNQQMGALTLQKLLEVEGIISLAQNWFHHYSVFTWRKPNRFLNDCITLISGFRRDVAVVLYRRFGTTYRSHLQGSTSPSWNSSWTSWPLKIGLTGCTETSVQNTIQCCLISQRSAGVIQCNRVGQVTERLH
jgi:hypothetical protein